MKMWIGLVLLYFVNITSCFLLDGNSKADTNPALMTDSHYTTLLNMLLEERKAREQLQQYVVHLTDEVVGLKEASTNCSCKTESSYLELYNKTLKQEEETKFLKSKLQTLELQYSTVVKTQANSLASQARVENEVHGIKHSINNISDFNFIIGLQNMTNQYKLQLQTTDTKLQAVEAEARARSNDIMALLNMVQSHEHKSDRAIKKLASDFNNTLQALGNGLQMTVDNMNSTINQQINKMSDKVALSAKPINGVTVSPFTVIKFGSIVVSEGISDLSSFKQTGKFVCNNPGVYIISVQISTNTNNYGYFFLYKNNSAINIVYRFQHNKIMTMTTTVVQKLNTNDEIRVQNGDSDMVVYGGIDSSLNIVQIR